MARRNKRSSRRSRKKSSNDIMWIATGVVGVVVLIVAYVLLTGEEDASGQRQFDPNFEPEVTGAPRVEVLPQDVIDYGDVKLNSTINTTYTVRNVGDEPLVVYGEPQVELVQGC